MTPNSTLDNQVRQLRAGKVYSPSRDPHSAAALRVIVPIISMAASNLDNQLERLDRFSLPVLPSNDANVRTNPARTAELFLNQLRSDYRRVVIPAIDLTEIESVRQEDEWAKALKAHGVDNRPVAILAVGQYLASDHANIGELEVELKHWLSGGHHADNMVLFETTLGPVVGPLVYLGFGGQLEKLPGWADQVGKDWCYSFLASGAQQLRREYRQPVYVLA